MKPQVTTNEGTQGLLTGIVQAIRAFVKDLRSRIPNFSKKCHIPDELRFLPICSRIVECDKFQGTFCKGSKGILTITVEVKRSFL